MATPDDDKDDGGEFGGRWAPTHNRGEHLLQTEIGMHNEGMGAKIIYPWSVVVMVMVTGQSREEKGDRI